MLRNWLMSEVIRGFSMLILSAKRTAALAMIAMIAALYLMACDDSASYSSEEGDRTIESVRGMVLEVEQESLISLEALEIEDGEGKVWRFEGRGKVVAGFTPSHLNEHKLLGQSVEVTFYREDAALVLHDITD